MIREFIDGATLWTIGLWSDEHGTGFYRPREPRPVAVGRNLVGTPWLHECDPETGGPRGDGFFHRKEHLFRTEAEAWDGYAEALQAQAARLRAEIDGVTAAALAARLKAHRQRTNTSA